MKDAAGKGLRCAIYTRVSTEAGLEQDFNSLDAQREASEAYIKSQAHEGWRLITQHYDDGGYSGGTLQRPALQALLTDVKAGLVDVILVYKVDRLTRSLADFAKLVELFDANDVSFVSVTQSFNTTSSMGRLTLNVLLSFAQFEREVTGERIRDKIAASKKKGIWMGGHVPLGYRAENRKLIIVLTEAETVRMLFRRYLELGTIPAVLSELNVKGVVTKRRQAATRSVGGISFTVGPLAHLLKNRIYIGQVHHAGRWYPGEHEAIVDQETFNTVQARLADNRQARRDVRRASNALLLGKIVDDRGNTMSPSHASKGSVRHRYYVSRAVVERRSDLIGAVRRASAADIEPKILEALRSALSDRESDGNALLDRVRQVRLGLGQITVELTQSAAALAGKSILSVTWSPRPKKVKRDIILPHADLCKDQRPIRAERRTALLKAIGSGRAWLKELSCGTDIEAIAVREGRSKRSVQMIVSLVFVAPDIVEAAVAGALPRGIGLTRLMDLPPLWTDQRRELGLRT